MKNCPSCGGKIEDDAKFCTYCGIKIEEEDKKTKFCPKCGSIINENEEICPICKYNNNSNNNIYQSSVQYNSLYRKNEQNRNTAITSIIFSIMGLVTCFFPFSIVGIVLGFICKNKCEKNTQEYAICVASIVIGIIEVVFIAFAFLCIIIALTRVAMI